MLLPATHRDVKVRMVDITADAQLLQNGVCLGNLSPVDTVEQQLTDAQESQSYAQLSAHATSATREVTIVQSLVDKLPAELTNVQHEQVDLLHKYEDIFSKGDYDMGRTTLVQHTIDTGDHRPIRQELRRHPTVHLDIIDQQVNELVKNDLVEPAASSWASYVALVRKKDGSNRLCVDYRDLNLTIVIHYHTWTHVWVPRTEPYGPLR